MYIHAYMFLFEHPNIAKKFLKQGTSLTDKDDPSHKMVNIFTVPCVVTYQSDLVFAQSTLQQHFVRKFVCDNGQVLLIF